jgi:HAD superfamily hydrolase (TIGR01509 family)
MINTVIFDMDGLLIDSEPLWQEAGIATLAHYGINITVEQYHKTTGLRTKEWLEYWFTYFDVAVNDMQSAVLTIENKAIENIQNYGIAFAGTLPILNFCREQGYQIGLATSSPLRLVDVVVQKLGIQQFFDAYSSAEHLPLGKPHPQVYINCAQQLQATPLECLCFEDSFNGMIAAKAARMRCIVVPEPSQFDQLRWATADAKLSRLEEFDRALVDKLENEEK